LTKVDEKWRRIYELKSDTGKEVEEKRKISFNKLNQIGLKRIELVRNHLSESNKLDFKNNEPLPKKIVISSENNIWSGFHKKTVDERISQISKVFKNVEIDSLKSGGLNLIRADTMIENCVGLLSLPVGLG
jgi:hypothetical protein